MIQWSVELERLIDGRRWIWHNTASKPVFVRGLRFPILHIVDDEKGVWSELLQRHDQKHSPDVDGVIWDSLAAPSCDDIRAMLCHKSMRKATGIADLPLRVVSRLSDDCLMALGKFISYMESLRVWPLLIHTLVRLPKPSGGHRLIALLHDLAKLWGVIRRPLVAE